MKYEELLNLAKEVSKNAYAPYSNFKVGACVLTDSEKVFTGCNFENSSYGMTVCAERNAVGSSVTAGERKIKAVAIYSPNMKNCTPCGACRQVLSEFKGEHGLKVITELDNGIKIYDLDELLPVTFGL